MGNVSGKSCREVKTHISCSINLKQNGRFYKIHVEKSCRVGHATDDNVELAHCMLDD